MTVAHLAFSIAITVYILTAVYFEERDLVRFPGKAYADYRQKVPMLIPRLVTRHQPSADRTNLWRSGMMGRLKNQLTALADRSPEPTNRQILSASIS